MVSKSELTNSNREWSVWRKLEAALLILAGILFNVFLVTFVVAVLCTASAHYVDEHTSPRTCVDPSGHFERECP